MVARRRSVRTKGFKSASYAATHVNLAVGFSIRFLHFPMFEKLLMDTFGLL